MKCFNKLLSADREKELSQDEITKTSRAIQNHHCFLHVIINLGDNATSSGLKDLDSCCLSEDASAYLTKGCSSTYTCILLAARLFHQMGSEKYGRSDVFEAYLHSQEDECQGADRGQLGKSRQNTQILAKRSYSEREVGNRAHITFHNGTALWYHKDDVKEVLNALKADGNISEAPQSLEYLLHTKVPLAGARALGIIKFCVTGPFQHAFDIKCGHIVEMVPYTIELRAAMEKYSQDATDLLANPRSVLTDIPVKESQYTKALFEETNDPEMDAFTIMALQLLLGNMLILFERQCEEYLAEGTYSSVTEEQKQDARNCPLTNRPCEAAMAQLDQGLKFRPNATPGYLEASIILKSSQLPQHLSSLSEDEKAEEFKIARKMGTELLERSKDKLKMIVETRKALVKQQQVTMLNKKEKEVALKSKIVSEISRFGGEWKSPGMVEMELSKLERENQKRDALEWQIRYHSKVLKTKDYVPKDKRKRLFRLSLETKELKKNLKEILKYAPHLQDLADVQTDEARITAHTLLTDSERKRLFDERASILKERLNKQRENRKEKKKPSDEVETAKESNQNQKKGKQRKDLPSPGSLIGKRVEHIFMIADQMNKCCCHGNKCLHSFFEKS